MRRMIARPWVVLLAAGGSRRFGRPKQLARLGRETLLRRAVRVALACSPAGCVVVLGAEAARTQREIDDLPVRIVIHRSWRTGMSGSLRAGLRALPRTARGALILLADQAAIGPAELELLIAAWLRVPDTAVAACVDGVRGPPAILPRSSFPILHGLRGDRGARALLRDPGRRVIEFEMPGAACDVDRPRDLTRLRKSRARN